MTKHFALRSIAAAAMLACISASASDGLVISQAYGGGGNSGATLKNDFIELFNPTAAAISLNGKSLQYGNATNTAASWGVTQLPNKTIQPGAYFLIKLAAGSGGTELTGEDHAATGLNMGGTAGKVALVQGSAALVGAAAGATTVIDLLGWGGSSTVAYEGAPAAATTNATALFRAGNGCTDTNHNGNDFATAAPAPRNSFSPLNMCTSGPVAKPIVPSCPASAAIALGYGGSVGLSASDADSIVNNAAITGGAVAGISLVNLQSASEAGGSASVTLEASAGVPAGSYPVAVKFGNDAGQEASCTVTLNVAPPAPVTFSIPQIQGPGATSPYHNTVQTTEGVVTAKVGTGFFIQDLNGDGDPATSDGIFVYLGNGSTTASVGDLVRVTGTVTEFTPSGASRSYTEFKDTTAIVKLGGGYSVNPTNVALLSTRLADVEGMLVRFTNTLTVSDAESLGERGELTLSVGRREIPTNRYPARSAEAIALAADNAANKITLDDGIFVAPAVVPYIGQDGTVRVGDTVDGLTGVIDFGATGSTGPGFKLQPTQAPTFYRSNPRTAAPEVAPGNLKVASANVLNYFTTFADGKDVNGNSGQTCYTGSGNSVGNCRGANNLTEFVRQHDKIVAKLKAIDADVVGLMEIQNNGDYAVGYLVNALNAAYGKTEYAYVPKPPATGTDAIRVAMIYKPAKLALVGNALSDADNVNDRPPMAQAFKAANGARFSVIVNHLKSKRCSGASGDNVDAGDGQSCYNGDRMRQAARLVNSFVPQVTAAAGDPDVLLIGDFNAYGMEDPIMAITAAGYVNQLERFVRPVTMPHSYVFNAESGYLDHALASASLNPQVAGVTEWNVNADEPVVLDYNLESKGEHAKSLYNAQPYRASDHDPVVISLDLPATYQDVTSGMHILRGALLQARGASVATSTVTITNNTGKALGPVHYLVPGLPAGVTLANASGSFNGVPYFTVLPSMEAGVQAAFQLKFNNPARVNFVYTPQIYTGSF